MFKVGRASDEGSRSRRFASQLNALLFALFPSVLFLASALLSSPALADESGQLIVAQRATFQPNERVTVDLWTASTPGPRAALVVERLDSNRAAEVIGRVPLDRFSLERAHTSRSWIQITDLREHIDLPSGRLSLRLDPGNGSLSSQSSTATFSVSERKIERESFSIRETRSLGVTPATNAARSFDLNSNQHLSLRDSLAEPSRRTPARTFIVSGSPQEQVAAVLRQLESRPATPTSGTDIAATPHGEPSSLAFHHFLLNARVELRRVELVDQTIELRYGILPFDGDALEPGLTLIPLPELAPGRYTIDVRPELDRDSSKLPLGTIVPRWISGSSTLEVQR